MSDEPLTAEQPLGHLTPDELLGGDFDTVILATVDIQGRLVGKRLSPRAFVNKVLTGIHVCTCTLAWDMDQSLEGIAVEYAGLHTGWHDFVIAPDVSTLRVAAWSDRTAICLGDAVDHDGELVPIAPRTILRRQLERLAAAGLTATTATELEFFLYRGSYESARERDYRDLVPTTTRHADYAIQETEDLEYFFGPLRRALEQSGLPADMCQGEWGLGQWEMNLDHGAPLAIADAHALFKLGVKTIGSRAGLSASFMARPETDTGIGSSCHVHVSLRDDDGRALFHDADDPDGISPAIRHGVAGVLERAPELMLWYAPTVNSYRRTASDDFAGRGATWGFDNRTVTCRVVAGRPPPRGWSTACPAPTSTPTSRSPRCWPRSATDWRAPPTPGRRPRATAMSATSSRCPRRSTSRSTAGAGRRSCATASGPTSRATTPSWRGTSAGRSIAASPTGRSAATSKASDPQHENS